MAITPEGAVWLGTYGEGLARLEGNQFRRIHLDNIKPDNAEALVKCMIADNEGNIWIGQWRHLHWERWTSNHSEQQQFPDDVQQYHESGHR